MQRASIVAARVACAPARLLAPVRTFASHGHGHGGPVKTLPPKPASLPANATLGQRIEYALWEKRHPDYEGAESYVRFYLPENHQIVLAILGLYGFIAVYNIRASGVNKAAEVHAMPAPEKPDFHTVKSRSAIPEFGTPDWESFMAEGEGAVQQWFASLEELAAAK